jgi:hypothetical protein
MVKTMNTTRVRYTLAALALAASAAHGQQVSVTEISDKRTTGKFFAGMEVKLSVVGAGLADSRGLRRVKLDKAVDDTGRNLLREERFPKGPFDGETSAPRGDALDFELSLANPSRQAKTLAEVTGYVELHTPHRDAKSILNFGPLSSLYGKKLPLPAPLATRLGIIPVDKALYEEMKKSAAAPAGSGGELVQALRSLFSGGGMDADAVGFIVQGDLSDVVAIEVTDAQGKALKHQGRFSSGTFTSMTFPGGAGREARIRVYLATPQSVVRIPIQLKGVVLP